MRVIDQHGRLLGAWHLVDVLAALMALALVPPLAFAARVLYQPDAFARPVPAQMAIELLVDFSVPGRGVPRPGERIANPGEPVVHVEGVEWLPGGSRQALVRLRCEGIRKGRVPMFGPVHVQPGTSIHLGPLPTSLNGIVAMVRMDS